MRRNKTLFIIFFLLSGFCFGQTFPDKLLTGKIIVDTTAVESVNIVNSRTEKAAITNKDGIFTISARTGDVLKITAVNLETVNRTVASVDFSMNMILVKMNPKATNIPEVIINQNSDITAENLRIIPYGQKKYTPAERKLYTAQSGMLDPLLNKISGRTAMLKKEVVVEKKEKLLVRLDRLYEDNYYTDILHISPDYIKGFQYYLIEDADFVRALQAKNKTMTMFLIKRLALNYNALVGQDSN